jgi:ATP-dependent DNA ligase
MTSFPEWIEPMAATLTYERFAGPEWIFERKIDGIRLLAFKKGEGIQWTGNDKLRHPRLVGIRNDKHAREVVREQP